MSAIKPIETVYNGYRFRSRLEAKWAVFFDNAGIKYQYEPDGYKISPSTYYLPDFYLPDYKVFVEVKPYIAEKASEWKEKCKAFRDAIDKSIFIVFGDPMERNQENTMYCFWRRKSSYEVYVHEAYVEFTEAYNHITQMKEIILYVEDYNWGKDEIILTEKDEDSINKYVCCEGMIAEYWWDKACGCIHDNILGHEIDDSRGSVLDSARIKSRKARFEHGECGQ